MPVSNIQTKSSCNRRFIVSLSGEYRFSIYGKACNEHTKESNTIPNWRPNVNFGKTNTMFAGKHLEKRLWNAFGDLLEDSSWTTALTQAGVASSSIADSLTLDKNISHPSSNCPYCYNHATNIFKKCNV